jgi:hypothetical protein
MHMPQAVKRVYQAGTGYNTERTRPPSTRMVVPVI